MSCVENIQAAYNNKNAYVENNKNKYGAPTRIRTNTVPTLPLRRSASALTPRRKLHAGARVSVSSLAARKPTGVAALGLLQRRSRGRPSRTRKGLRLARKMKACMLNLGRRCSFLQISLAQRAPPAVRDLVSSPTPRNLPRSALPHEFRYDQVASDSLYEVEL